MRHLDKTALATALLAAALLGPSAARAGETRTVTFDAQFGPARLDENPAGLASVRLEATRPLSIPGAPALPYRPLRLALPPDADLATVRVSVAPLATESLPGRFRVTPAPVPRTLDDGRAHWGGAQRRIVDGRDTAIYGVDAPYPKAHGAAIGAASERRGFKSIEVALYPVRYRPLTRDLVQATALRVVVTYSPQRAAPRPRCRLDDPLAARMFANFADATGWYGPVCAPAPAPGDAGIAVITTAELAAASETLLDAWTALRSSQGYTVRIATDDPANPFYFDESTGDPTEDTRADRIRKWLIDNREELDLGWVLLIGNPDPSGAALYPIPMKICAVYDGTAAPTDFYYANLTDDFDGNGNGTYCEEDDDVDFVPDVYVGRLPVYSDGAAAVDEMLERILAYEEESLSGDLEWRRRVLLPDSIYFYKYQYCDTGYMRWDGATVGEWFIREELRPRGLVWTAMYEREGHEPSQFESHFQVDSWHMVDQWSRGYGFVFWTGHGSSSGVYRTVWTGDPNDNLCADWEELSSPEFMAQSLTGMLESAPPPFVVHGSCSNATPETADNLGYNLLRRGAIATLAATRSAITWHWPDEDPEVWEKPSVIDGDVIDMTTEYAQSVLHGGEAGRAHGDMIALTSDFYGDMAAYQKSIQNLYGDPLVRLVMCRTGADCDDGDYCDGVEQCDDGSCEAGTPIACAPTEICDDMVCDEAVDACVPGPSCPDAGAPDDAGAPPTVPDAGPPDAATTGFGAGSGSCAAAPPAAVRSLLSRVL
jgi:hypothetical protein